MSSAAPTSVADREHRLTVAEGLLSAIASGPRALEAARKFLELDTDPSVSDATTLLREQIESLRSEVAEADSVADMPLETAAPRKRRRRRRKETKVNDTAITEAAVTGNPPVPNSPSSQTGAEAAQTTAWGGPNPGAIAATVTRLRGQGYQVTVPPNLRDGEGWEVCANCVFFNHGCNLYGFNRDGDTPDAFHDGQYPVDADDLCDSHYSLTPQVQRHVNVLDRADNMLAEAARAENGEAILRARARVGKAQERLDEALELDLVELWSEAARAAALISRRQHRGGAIPGRPEGEHIDKLGLTRDHGESAIHYAMRRLSKPSHISKLGANHVTEKARAKGQMGFSTSLKPKPNPFGKGGAQRASIGVPRGVARAASEQSARHAAIDRGTLKLTSSQARERERMLRHQATLRHSDEGGEAVSGTARLSEVKSSAYPGLDRSPKKNWVDKAGGLPSYIERIAKHLHYEKGKDIGHAIAIAVNVVKKMCGSGDTNFPGKQNVNAKSRAEACAAVAQWEAKKGKAKAKDAAESALITAFVPALALYEEAFKPIPPSWNLIESLLGEIGRADGPDWYVGMSEIDEALELIDEIGIDEAAAELDESVLKRLGVHFDPRKHPRAPKGRTGGGRFSKVLDKLHTDMGGHRGSVKEQMRAARHGRQLPRGAGADQGGMGRTAPARRQPPVATFERTLKHPERSPRAAEYGLAPQSIEDHFREVATSGQRQTGSDYEMSGKTVTWKGEQWYVVGEENGNMLLGKRPDEHLSGAVEVPRKDLGYASGQRQESQNVPADLTVDMAIGGVLSSFPNVKDWSLDDPTADEHGTKSWALHVTLADGKAHHIAVNEDGQVSEMKPPKAKVKPVPAEIVDYAKNQTAKNEAVKQAAYAKIASAETGGLVPTGDTNVVSHMQPGTIFKGTDDHFYKHHGDEWMAGKKGPLKGVHLENLDTGTHKTVPYFAIHGKEYPIYAAPGSFQKKELGSPSSADDVFGSLLKSVQGQHGSLSSVAGKNVVITGKIDEHPRAAIHKMIVAAGGTPHSSVAKNTDVLVTGDKVGAVKINAAKAKGVMVIPWSEFKHLVEAQIGVDEAAYALVCGELEEGADSAMVYRLRARRDVLARRIEEKTYSAGERRANATIGDDRYPIGDAEHAKQALIRLNQGGLSNAEKAKVIAKAAKHLGGDHALVKRRRKELS